MSNYPIWWDTTVTIYNRYKDPQTDVVRWFRHTVTNCFWKDTGNKVSVGDTVLETNDIICRIPEDPKFLEPYAWAQLPNDKMSEHFTCGADDIIVKGEITDEIDEYVRGKHSSDLLTKYKGLQGCMTVERMSINIGPGRVCPHYYVKGI